MSNFPTANIYEDAKYFAQAPEDPAVRSSMEGGYVVSRARHTRVPRKSFKTGFTALTQTQMVAIDAFYTAKRGGSTAFTWTNPTTNVELTVRFKREIQWNYVGASGTHLWDAMVELEEV